MQASVPPPTNPEVDQRGTEVDVVMLASTSASAEFGVRGEVPAGILPTMQMIAVNIWVARALGTAILGSLLGLGGFAWRQGLANSDSYPAGQDGWAGSFMWLGIMTAVGGFVVVAAGLLTAKPIDVHTESSTLVD
jgi:hypothetical protein